MSTQIFALALAFAVFLPASSYARSCPPFQARLRQSIVTCRPHLSMEECRRLAEEIGCSVVRSLDLINAVVVTVPDGEAALHAALPAAQVEDVEPDLKQNWIQSVSGFELPPVEEVIRPFRLSFPAAAPAADEEQPWGVRRVNAAAAWPQTMGAGVKIAVMDTGIDVGHPELKAAVAGGFNAVDADKPGAYGDEAGHGTYTAGVIAAARDGRGIAGVAPQARIYSVKVFDAAGNGTFSSLIAGLQWCLDNGIHVVNMSLGSAQGSEALAKAVSAAARAGLVLVASVGNEHGRAVTYPAAYPEVIAVSSSDQMDGLSVFSNVGPEVDFIAPGTDINSTRMGGGFAVTSGTSVAAPHVAGLAALAIARGARGPAAVRAALAAAASPLPGLGSSQQGGGLVDAARLPARLDGVGSTLVSR